MKRLFFGCAFAEWIILEKKACFWHPMGILKLGGLTENCAPTPLGASQTTS